jgi:hypothetical protein
MGPTWLWRTSRRVVTHNYQLRVFEPLLADLKSHFDTFTQTLVICFVISAVRLHQTFVQLSHEHMPHDSHRSI